jgi:hypothetical protein
MGINDCAFENQGFDEEYRKYFLELLSATG